MSDRHPKWTPVEPGTVIPALLPYRVEYVAGARSKIRVTENVQRYTFRLYGPRGSRLFVDGRVVARIEAAR